MSRSEPGNPKCITGSRRVGWVTVVQEGNVETKLLFLRLQVEIFVLKLQWKLILF